MNISLKFPPIDGSQTVVQIPSTVREEQLEESEKKSVEQIAKEIETKAAETEVFPATCTQPTQKLNANIEKSSNPTYFETREGYVKEAVKTHSQSLSKAATQSKSRPPFDHKISKEQLNKSYQDLKKFLIESKGELLSLSEVAKEKSEFASSRSLRHSKLLSKVEERVLKQPEEQTSIQEQNLEASIPAKIESPKTKEKTEKVPKKIDIRKQFRNAFLNEKDSFKQQQIMWKCALQMNESALLKQLNFLFAAKDLTNEQKKTILVFAKDAVESGVIGKKIIVHLPYLVLPLIEKSKNDSELKELAQEFKEAVKAPPNSYITQLNKLMEIKKNLIKDELYKPVKDELDKLNKDALDKLDKTGRHKLIQDMRSKLNQYYEMDKLVEAELEQLDKLFKDNLDEREKQDELVNADLDKLDKLVKDKYDVDDLDNLAKDLLVELNKLDGLDEQIKDMCDKLVKAMRDKLNKGVDDLVKVKLNFDKEVYGFLIRPGHKQFRKDILLSGPMMNFVKEAQEKQDALTPILVQEIREILKNSNSVERKKIVLEFAAELVEQGIFKKEVFEKEMFSVREMLALIAKARIEAENPLKENHLRLVDPAKRFIAAEAKQTQNTAAIQYAIKHSTPNALSQKFDRIAKGEMNQKELEKFTSDFAKDLTSISSNAMRNISNSEWNKKPWEAKNQSAAPNTTNALKTFNQITAFTVDQLVTTQNDNLDELVEELVHLYTADVMIIKELLKHHDYFSALAMSGALGQSSVVRLNIEQFLPKKIVKEWKEIQTIFDPSSNYKNLRMRMEKHEEAGEAYTPLLTLLFTDFTFINDGNPHYLQDGATINFERLELTADKFRKREEAIVKLKEQKELNYDLDKEILKGTFMDENQQHAKSLAIQPYGKILEKTKDGIKVVDAPKAKYKT